MVSLWEGWGSSDWLWDLRINGTDAGVGNGGAD